MTPCCCSGAQLRCRGGARAALRRRLSLPAPAQPAPPAAPLAARRGAQSPATLRAAAAADGAAEAPFSAAVDDAPRFARRSALAHAACAAALLAATPRARADADAAGASAGSAAVASSAGTALELTTYRDEKSRFSLVRPTSWEQVSKAGASVLFKDPAASISTLGVTVSPVLVQSLAQFGTLAEVTAKVVAAEREKESTLSVEVLASRERQTASGAAVYEIDYLLDSSRGRKRVLNAVCITNATLYIYALQFKAAEDAPTPAVASIVPQLLASFEPGA